MSECPNYENCMDCPCHRVEADPDPDDWFCDDDEKVVCAMTKKNITVACRPYNKRKECQRPTWCPLLRPINEWIKSQTW